MDTPRSPLEAFRKSCDPKLTLEQLGAELSVNKSTILRWEKGDVAIPLDRLTDLERITGIPRSLLRPDVYGSTLSSSVGDEDEAALAASHVNEPLSGSLAAASR